LRQLNKHVPADLETIVLHACAKEPADRYASAREFADDLRRFLSHRPISARRTSWIQRLGRWGRRHRVLVLLGFASVLVVSAVLTVSTVMLFQARNTAVSQRRLADEHRDHTSALLIRTLHHVNLLHAVLQRREFADDVEVQRVRKSISKKTEHFFQRFINESSDDSASRYRTASAFLSLANFYLWEGDLERARSANMSATAHFADLVSTFPDDSFVWQEFAQCRFQQADLFERTGDLLAARNARNEALQLMRKATAIDPQNSRALNLLAWSLTDPQRPYFDPAQSVELARRAVALSPLEATYWNTLGVAEYRAGNYQGAVQSITRSMEKAPHLTGLNQFVLAMAQWQLGRKHPARSTYAMGLAWMADYDPDDPGILSYRDEAAALLNESPKRAD
jgi:tetratricopeptide (TPR) repeat protein